LLPTGEIQVNGEFVLIIDGTDPQILGSSLISNGSSVTIENGVTVSTGSFTIESRSDATFTPGSQASRTIQMKDAVIVPSPLAD
jgi:hypothetical protein